MVMASLQYMIDVSAFSRTSDDPDTPEFEIRRTPRPSARNVTTAPLPVSRDATRKIRKIPSKLCRPQMVNPAFPNCPELY